MAYNKINEIYNIRNVFVVFLIIIILLISFCVQSSSGSDLPPPPLPPQIPSGTKIAPAGLVVNMFADESEVFRGDPVKIHYNIEYWGGSSDKRATDVSIHIPEEFSRIYEVSLLSDPSIEMYTYDHKITLEIPGTGRKADLRNNVSLNFLADVSLDARTGPLTLDTNDLIELSRNYEKNYHATVNISYINIKNNKPNITAFYLSDCVELFDSNDSIIKSLFRDEMVCFSCEGYDIENISLNWSLWYANINDENNKTLIKSIKGKSGNIKIPYSASVPGTHLIEFRLTDMDGDSDKRIITLHIDTKSKNEYISKIYWTYAFAITIVSLVMIIIRRLFVFKHIPIFAGCSFVVCWIFGWIRSIPLFELYLYGVVLTFAAYFIESNFYPSKYPMRSSWKDSFQEIWKNIMLDLTNRSFPTVVIRAITSGDIKLWITSVFAMYLIICIIILYLPETELFKQGPTPELYSYINSYYSANINAFGVILAIVVAFAIWYLDSAKELIVKKTNIKTYKKVVINFIFLYVFLIILSVLGLAIGTIPELNVTGQVNTIPQALSIIALQCTLLLVIPAFICLYEFASWIMSIYDDEPPYRSKDEISSRQSESDLKKGS